MLTIVFLSLFDAYDQGLLPGNKKEKMFPLFQLIRLKSYNCYLFSYFLVAPMFELNE